VIVPRLSWLVSVPASVGGSLVVLPEVLNGLRVLPDILERLERIAETTEALPELNETLREVSQHTAALPEVREQVREVTKATVVMEGHTAQILETIPSLSALEESLPAFATGLEELTVLLTQFEATVSRLAVVVEPLQGAAERFGRFADRLPRRAAPRQ
jgi:ABC-type transporter Mla subunit MlaD